MNLSQKLSEFAKTFRSALLTRWRGFCDSVISISGLRKGTQESHWPRWDPHSVAYLMRSLILLDHRQIPPDLIPDTIVRFHVQQGRWVGGNPPSGRRSSVFVTGQSVDKEGDVEQQRPWRIMHLVVISSRTGQQVKPWQTYGTLPGPWGHQARDLHHRFADLVLKYWTGLLIITRQ